GALVRGGSLFRTGRFGEAADLLGGVLQGLERAGFRKARELNVRARLLRAVALYNRGDRFEEAASAFRTVSDAGGEAAGALRVRGAYGLVLALLGGGDAAGAEAAAGSFLERFPSAALAPEVRFWRGEALLRLKRFADARAELERVPAGHARGPEAALGRAYSLYAEGLWLDASEAFGRAAAALTESPDLRAEAMLRRAEAAFNARDYEAAASGYREISRAFPDSPMAETAALQLGEMLFRRADYPAAAAAFAEFLRKWPKSASRDEALYWRGLSQIRQGRFALARVSLERLVRDFPESRFRTAAVLQVGHAYYNEGRFEESAAAYRRALSGSPSPDEAREAKYGLVLTRLRSGNTEQFIRDVRTFIEKEPDAELATALEFQVAEIHLARKRYREALAVYVRVLRKGGNGADVAHFRIGEIKRLQGKPAEAADYFRDLIEKFPDSRMRGDARFRLAESLQALGDCDGALREYRLFIREYPEHSLLTQARYGAGTCALRLKDTAAAARFFSHVVRSGGEGKLVARSFYELGRIARREGRWAEALNHLEAALKGGVGRKLQPAIQFELGSLRESLKQYPRAVVEYLKVVYLYPQERGLGSRALLRVAGIYELQGKRAQALRLYRKVEKEAPDPSVRALAGERILRLEEKPDAESNPSRETAP
ncbi:MAG: tetratricopeptide repeat protein, partial [Nitrospinota bacterium]